MLFTAQARSLKTEKVKKAVKNQVKENITTSKSCDDYSKDILRMAAKHCGISKGGQRQKTAWWWNMQVKK